MDQSIYSGTMTINGNEVYYEYYPNPYSKKTKVLLHGFLSSSFSYRRLIPLLKEEFQVLSVDLPPFGKSGKSTRFIYSYKNLADTIIKLAENLGIDRIYPIGHSMGGQIALNILHYWPEKAEKAVLICSSAYMERLKPHIVFSSYIPFFHLYVKFWLARSGVLGNLRQVVFDQALIDDEMVSGYSSPFLDNQIFKALSCMIRDREGDLPSGSLKNIANPCLLIWGEKDRIVPLYVGEKLAADLKNAQLVVFPRTGHLVPEEKPEETCRHIREFLQS